MGPPLPEPTPLHCQRCFCLVSFFRLNHPSSVHSDPHFSHVPCSSLSPCLLFFSSLVSPVEAGVLPSNPFLPTLAARPLDLLDGLADQVHPARGQTHRTQQGNSAGQCGGAHGYNSGVSSKADG